MSFGNSFNLPPMKPCSGPKPFDAVTDSKEVLINGFNQLC